MVQTTVILISIFILIMTTNAIAIFYGPKVKGTITFTQTFTQDKSNKVKVQINLSGLGKNKVRAIHIHEFGNMLNGCDSLGGHWNPTNKNHGSTKINGKNHHAGDMINNIKSNSNGVVNLTYYDTLIKLTGKNNIFGRSVVIHANPDDLGLGNNKESLITGNAGKRIACGIIVHYKN